MRARSLLYLAVLALLAVSCGRGGRTAAQKSPAAPAGAQRFTVHIDGAADGFSGVFTAFFPDKLTVHPGDTVTFELPHVFNGQAHSVTMGTLVDAAVAKLAMLGPQASLAAQESSPEMLHLPDVYPHEITGGEQDANQSSGEPCYLDAGIPPLSLTGGAAACPQRDKPEFAGTQSFYNSGALMGNDATFTVPISKTTKPGTYGVMCMMHRSAGTGQITVVPGDQPVPTPDEVTAGGRQQLQRLVDVLKPVAAKADEATPDNAVAGAVDPDVVSGLVAKFGPATISIPVGGTVTWHVNAFHTISFGAQESDVGSLVKAADGSIHLNPKGNFPAGYQVPDAAFAFPPPDDGHPIVVDGGRWDGSGFRSTGLLASLPPAPVTVKQSFSKAGTYAYRCLFHPAMAGEIKVG